MITNARLEVFWRKILSVCLFLSVPLIFLLIKTKMYQIHHGFILSIFLH